MIIDIGNSSVINLSLGNSSIKSVWLGNVIIWPSNILRDELNRNFIVDIKDEETGISREKYLLIDTEEE